MSWDVDATQISVSRPCDDSRNLKRNKERKLSLPVGWKFGQLLCFDDFGVWSCTQ